MIWLWLSAGLMVATAATHAVLGERRLIGPMLALDTGILSRPLARQLVRFAWHLTSVLMIVCALLVVWPGTPVSLIVITGSVWLATGLVDCVVTRGKHVGWPILTASGACALIGTLS